MAAEGAKADADTTMLNRLRPDTAGHNLVVKVLENKPVQMRQGGGRAGTPAPRVSECLVGDESGTMYFTARNEQVDAMPPGAYVALRGAKVDMFRSSMRLVVDQRGSVEPAKDVSFQPKADYNLSLVEYELVSIAGIGAGAPPAPNAAVTAGA